MDSKHTIGVRVTQVSPFLESHGKLERHLANARVIVAAAGRGIALSLRVLGARFARWRRQRHTYDALMRCSDRVLADIGIEREDIPLIAKGIDPREYHGRAPRGWWREVGKRLDAASRARREWRRLYRELMAYNDRELDDLGIRRSDISAIAWGRLPAPA
jgi:uncharacterized protein YjiS (DUF1127 family)